MPKQNENIIPAKDHRRLKGNTHYYRHGIHVVGTS